MYNIQQSLFSLYSFLYLCFLGGVLFVYGGENALLGSIFNVAYYSWVVSYIGTTSEFTKVQQTFIFLPSLLFLLFLPNWLWAIPLIVMWIFALLSIWVLDWFEATKRVLFGLILISVLRSTSFEFVIPDTLLLWLGVFPLGLIFTSLNFLRKGKSVSGNMQLWLWIFFVLSFLLSHYFDVNYTQEFVWFWFGILSTGILLHLLSPNHLILEEFFFSHWIPTSSIEIFSQKYFGLDFRGLWTTQVLKKRFFALIYIVPSLLWFSSSLSVIPSDAVGIRENFGRLEEEPLTGTGLQFSLPYPFGTIHIVPTKRIFSLSIGHQEEENEDDNSTEIVESILWADQHADEEFTLLLGDGKDLISADGMVIYQITDPLLYLQTQRQAEEILEMLVYRALMMETSSRKLEDSLSENIQKLSQNVRNRVVKSIEEHQLGLVAIDVTLVALHPPVAVAEDYQDVVSAKILSKSAILHAQAVRERLLPQSHSDRYTAKRKAEGDAFKIIGSAIGEATAFLALQKSIDIQGNLYMFEAQHRAIGENVKGRRCTIIDHRIEEDGASLWIDKQ
jgi:regulator of protease activity HflC (stomatin/prohibitin superfamily)